MGFKSNIKQLSQLRNAAPSGNKAKIESVIKLYEEKKIPNFKTALNAVAKLTTPTLYKKGAADKSYDDLVDKYSAAEPITGRLSRKRKREPLLDIDLLFYKKKKPDEDVEGEEELVIDRLLSEQQKRSYKRYLSKKYPDLMIKWVGKAQVRARHDMDLSRLKGELVRQDDRRFEKLYKILREDPNVYYEGMGESYTPVAIMILKVSNNSHIEAVDPATIPKRAAGDKVAINYKYRTNPIDLSKDTFKEAIQLDKYISHECWINALYDFYSDTLFRTDKLQRYVITREKILEVINRTEEHLTRPETEEEKQRRMEDKIDIKNGLTFHDILPFFVKYKLRARIFDQYHKLVHRYDPPNIQNHNNVFYAMYDDDHVYTLNHNIKQLSQTLGEDKDEFRVYTSNEFYINEKRKPVKHFMIDSIDDILNVIDVIKEVPTEEEPQEDEDEKKEITYLVHKYDDLEELLWQLHDARYTPGIVFQAGKITSIQIEVDGMHFNIKTQQLNTDEIDGMIEVSQEAVYNRTNEAMVEFQNRLFRKEHMSYYSHEDIQVLDEYRTAANVGMLVDIDAYNKTLQRENKSVKKNSRKLT